MKSHFDEIKDELREQYRGMVGEHIILLLWLPRLYRSIKEKLPGREHKLGLWDVYNINDKQVSVIDAGNSSQMVDLLNLVSVLGCKKIIAIGLTGSFNFKIGTIFVPEKAYNEDIVTSYYGDKKIFTYSQGLFEKNKEKLRAYASRQKKDFAVGSIVSLDLFSRETEEFKRKYKKKVQCIDLEVAPLYLMCERHGIECFSFMIVSDILYRSYFLRKPKEINVYRKMSRTLPGLIKKLEF